jgi:glutamate carboxypeptidase
LAQGGERAIRGRTAVSGVAIDARELAAEVDRRLEEVLADIGRFVERETPSSDKTALDAFARFLAEYAGECGTSSVEVLEDPDHAAQVRITWGEGRVAAPVLLIGHFDTVHPIGSLDRMRFRREGDVLRGPGVFDMKAGLVQAFWAMKLLRARGFARPVTFVCNSDEETASVVSRPLIEREAARASAVLVMEPGIGRAVITQRKGIGFFDLVVTGKAAHAGRDYGAGVSAVQELARLTLELHAMNDPAAGTTVNVGVVSGGTVRNVVAASARAEIDVRVADEVSAANITRRIAGLRTTHPLARLAVTGGMVRPPMPRTPPIAGLFAQAQEIGRVLGTALDESATGGGSDANFCAALGRPVLDGLGAVGGCAHGLDEHILVSHIATRTALLGALIAQCAANEDAQQC